jgi:uncharacterized protein YndB with AHSA1/START domain
MTHEEKTPEFKRGKLAYERTFSGSVVDLWNLWTTMEGLESWWGPEGFDSKVRKLDLRPGGEFVIEMTAVGKEQIEGLKSMGMELTSLAHGRFTEVTPPRRLAFKTIADFIPGVKPYEVDAFVEFFEDPKGARMVVTEEVMHDQQWTEMSEIGMKSQLAKLAKILGK